MLKQKILDGIEEELRLRIIKMELKRMGRKGLGVSTPSHSVMNLNTKTTTFSLLTATPTHTQNC